MRIPTTWKTLFSIACVLLVPAAASAQSVTIPDRIEKLAAKAKESTDITLDGALLQLAGQFLSGSAGNEKAVKQIVSKLKGIHVRNFAFDKDGEYSDGDLDAIRSQLKSPAWSRVVESREDGEHTEIFVKQDKGGLSGLVILSAERKELSLVIIDGVIDLSQLSKLGGTFGIPKTCRTRPPRRHERRRPRTGWSNRALPAELALHLQAGLNRRHRFEYIAAGWCFSEIEVVGGGRRSHRRFREQFDGVPQLMAERRDEGHEVVHAVDENAEQPKAVACDDRQAEARHHPVAAAAALDVHDAVARLDAADKGPERRRTRLGGLERGVDRRIGRAHPWTTDLGRRRLPHIERHSAKQHDNQSPHRHPAHAPAHPARHTSPRFCLRTLRSVHSHRRAKGLPG